MDPRISYPTVLALNLPCGAILALESRVCNPLNMEVLSDTYNKMIELRPNTYLCCFGDCNVIEQVADALSQNLPSNLLLVGQIALCVQNTINAVVLENNPPIVEEENEQRATRFVLLGRFSNDSRHYFFSITKGQNSRMFFARREIGEVLCAGSEAVTAFLNENELDENMTEDEAVDYGFRCMKQSVRGWLVSGGIIRVVALRPEAAGCSIVHTWEQENPRFCLASYYHQEPRINRGY